MTAQMEVSLLTSSSHALLVNVRLADSREDVVVRNRSNRSFYRYVREEGDRVRIRPLELFPNGLLIEKSADTIVSGDLEVDVVGVWEEGEDFFILDKRAVNYRKRYEAELETRKAELRQLKADYDDIDPKKRGSHVNKLNAVKRRVQSIKRGLEDVVPEKYNTLEPVIEEEVPEFQPKDMVALPSGIPAMVLKIDNQEATVVCKPNGKIKQYTVDPVVLVPLSARALATI